MAPTPKPPGARRRRNANANAYITLAAGEGQALPVPPLPPAAKGQRWSRATRDWWATIWTSDLAPIYMAVDVAPLHRLARLHERAHRGEASAMDLRAMQALEDRFGLSPKARRSLLLHVVPRSEGPSEPRSSVHRIRAIDPSLAPPTPTKGQFPDAA